MIYLAMPTLGNVDVRMSTFLYSIIRRYDLEIVHTARQDIASARNFFLRDFLKTKCTHILFLDDDNPPEDFGFLQKLLESDKDIISGLVPSRNPDEDGIHRLCVFYDEEKKSGEHYYNQLINIPSGNEIIKISNCGMGCVLVKREVVQKVLEQYTHPCTMGEFWYYTDGKTHIREDDMDSYNIPDGLLRYKRYISEDLLFFERAKGLGYEVFAHKGVKCYHIGAQELIRTETHVTAKNFNYGLTIDDFYNNTNRKGK